MKPEKARLYIQYSREELLYEEEKGVGRTWTEVFE